MSDTRVPPGVLSQELIDELRMLDAAAPAESLLTTLVVAFRSSAAERVAQIHAAVASTDVPALLSAAHSLRGVAAAVGALRVQALAGQIENAARAGSADARELAAELDDAVPEAIRALEAALATNA